MTKLHGISILVKIIILVLMIFSAASCEDLGSKGDAKSEDKRIVSKVKEFVESKEHPKGIHRITMGGITFNLPAKFPTQNPPDRDFFSVYAIWTKWGGVMTGDEFNNDKRSNIKDYQINLIEILVNGNVENGQTYEEWKVRFDDETKNRHVSDIAGLNVLKSKNGKDFVYISESESFGLNDAEALSIYCGPVPVRLDNIEDSKKCYSSFRLYKNTYVEYRFQKVHLPEWSEMYKDIHRFLTSITSIGGNE